MKINNQSEMKKNQYMKEVLNYILCYFDLKQSHIQCSYIFSVFEMYFDLTEWHIVPLGCLPRLY